MFSIFFGFLVFLRLATALYLQCYLSKFSFSDKMWSKFDLGSNDCSYSKLMCRTSSGIICLTTIFRKFFHCLFLQPFVYYVYSSFAHQLLPRFYFTSLLSQCTHVLWDLTVPTFALLKKHKSRKVCTISACNMLAATFLSAQPDLSCRF